MPITSIRNIETPWAPYAVMFSRDGRRLAIGGGSWYGHGGIILMELDHWRAESLQWEQLPWVVSKGIHSLTSAPSGVPTISGLCFSDDDCFLAASMWSSSQHYAPTMLFEVNGTRLRARDVFEYQGTVAIAHPGGPRISVRVCGTPTGVLLHDGYVITRLHGATVDPQGSHGLVLDRLRGHIDVHASNHTQYLTHSRLVVVRDTVITEAGGSRGVQQRQPDGTYAPVPTPEGLALLDLHAPDVPPQVVRVESCSRVTAIAALPGNQGFVTGGDRGEIDTWSWSGEWRQHRLRDPVDRQGVKPSGVSWVSYLPQSIVAIASVAVSHALVAVTADGELLTFRKGRKSECKKLPQHGSPRSLGAHPSKPWVAVGIKQGGFGNPESVVAVFAVEP